MTFSAQIRQAVEPIWAASMKHPFVKGIGDGTLPLENFRFYIQQDSYYLTRFAKILAKRGQSTGHRDVQPVRRLREAYVQRRNRPA